MGSLTSKPQPATILGITVDNGAKSLYRSQQNLLLPHITRRLASELTAGRPPAHPDHASFPITIFAPAFEPKTGMFSNIKVVIFATVHLRCTLTSLNLLADLKQRVVGQWRRDLAAVRSLEQSRAKSKKKNKYCAEKKLAKLLERLSGDMRADDLRAVEEQQRSLLEELLKGKSELEEKRSSHSKWRGRWNAIYATAFFAVLASSVALAAASAPTPAMTAATVASTSMKAAEPWFDALWDGGKVALEGEKDVIKAMLRDVSAQLHQLNSVRVHVGELKDEVNSVIVRGHNAGSFFFDLKMKEEYTLAFEEVEKGIDVLGKMADGIQGDMKKAAANFVRMIADEI